MRFLKVHSVKELLLHTTAAIVLLLLLGYIFFEVYLPKVTKHGQSVTVPDLSGMQYDEAVAFLEKKNLLCTVSDSGYALDAKPLSVLTQTPAPNEKVKENRRIYLTIKATQPPQVKMPMLYDASLKNAEMVLRSFDLKLGNISYKPHSTSGLVLGQYYNGKKIEPGEILEKGSVIDLVVSDGSNEQPVPLPNLVGMDVEEAQTLLLGTNLEIGARVYVEDTDEDDGTIIRQKPEYNDEATIRIGSVVDVWIAGSDPRK